jgi:LysM repeat protein
MRNAESLFRIRWRWLALAFVIIGLVASPLAGGLSTSDAQEGGRQHIVQAGENLYRIALRYDLTVSELAAANGITDPTRIYAGQILMIPGEQPAATQDAPADTEPANSESATTDTATDETPAASVTTTAYHIVRIGETLNAIARQYGMTWQDIAALNNILDPNQIFAGQRLVITTTADNTTPDLTAVAGPTIVEADPLDATNTPSAQSTTYTVQQGDRLASIAEQFNLDWTTIARANGITNPNTIFAGQELTIPVTDDAPGTFLEPNGGVPAAAAPTLLTGKQIIINLTEQRIYAYEDGELLRSQIMSSGLPSTPTVTGDYRIYWKLTSQTMSGPGYYLPGVPWVMYFYQGYGIHGTYWHNNFGQPMSRGCINLPTTDAEWFFRWAEVGTPVSVRY